jgi:hypothetical protein
MEQGIDLGGCAGHTKPPCLSWCLTQLNIVMLASYFLFWHARAQLGNISVFYKQKSNLFYPVTSYSLPSTLLRIPLSAVSALLWTVMTYFVVGFAPDVGRCIILRRPQLTLEELPFLLFCVHAMNNCNL